MRTSGRRLGRAFRMLALTVAVSAISEGRAPARPGPQANQGASDAATIELVPTTVEVVPGGAEARARVIVRNAGKGTLLDPRVTAWTDAGLDVAIEAREPRSESIGPGDLAVWELRLTPKAEESVAGTVHVELDCREAADDAEAGADGRVERRKIVTMDLAVQARTFADAPPLLDVEARSTLATLDTSHPGQIALVLTNKTDLTLTVSARAEPEQHRPGQGISATTPSPGGSARAEPQESFRVSPGPGEPPLSVTLGPRQVDRLTFQVSAKDRVQPGKHLVSFPIDITWGKGGRRHMTVTQEIQVGVVGESAILTLLGVPTLLVLPGFLTLVTIELMWRLRASWQGQTFNQAAYPVTALSAPFWVLAISISILVFTGYQKWGHDILIYYGLIDLIWIWSISVGLGLLVFLLSQTGLGIHSLWTTFQENKRRKAEQQRQEQQRQELAKQTPDPKDSPLIILEKLANYGNPRSVKADRWKLTRGQQEQEVYRLGLRTTAEGKVWIMPGMLCEFTDASSRKALEPQFLDFRNKDDINNMFEFFKKNRDRLSLNWEQGNLIGGPAEVADAELIKTASPQSETFLHARTEE